MDDEEQVELHEGMKVSNEDGEELGVLSALLVEDDDEDAEFFLLKTAKAERLVPFEAVLGVGDGALIVDATAASVELYPAIKPGSEPTDADLERAYDVYDETAQYADDGSS
ncbi:MAG TPA: PRC-barrel domain-containing protein [Candidatus Thermoplasmatota archaeon]|nr:PRC-barrel domain-containing protein [Candidatus Thermoplasmatota archaeon]